MFSEPFLKNVIKSVSGSHSQLKTSLTVSRKPLLSASTTGNAESVAMLTMTDDEYHQLFRGNPPDGISFHICMR